jgi:hypothetical protein
MSKRVPCSGGCLLANPFGVSAASLAPHQILGVPLEQLRAQGSDRGPPEWIRKIVRVRLSYWRFSERNFTSVFCTSSISSLVSLQRFNILTPSTIQRLNSSLGVFLAIRSMSAIGITCPSSLAPPAATRFPSSIIIAVIVLPHRGQFRRSPRNTCSQ